MVWASHFLLRKNSLLPTTLVLLTLVTILHYCKICKRPQATCFIRIFCNPKIFVADAFSKSSSPNCSANCLRLIDVCAPSPSRFLISRHSVPLPLLPTSDSSQMEWFHGTLERMTAPSTRQRKAATSGFVRKALHPALDVPDLAVGHLDKLVRRIVDEIHM